MKHLFLSILFILATNFLFSQVLTIEIDNIENSEGVVLLTCYSEDIRWLADDLEEIERTFSKKGMINGKIIVTIDDLEPGIYGVAMHDDADGDRKMDSNFLGIPREGYGFSNNATARWSRPKFKECSFRLVSDTTIQMSMQYR